MSESHTDPTGGQQLPKHPADRAFERRTVWIAAGLAAVVTIAVSGVSLASVLYGVHEQIQSSDKRDDRSFRNQHEVAAVERWWSADAAMMFAEQEGIHQAQSRIKDEQVIVNLGLNLRDRLNALTAIGEELQAFTGADTFAAATRVVGAHLAEFDAVISLAQCAHDHNPEVGIPCDPAIKAITTAESTLEKDQTTFRDDAMTDIKP